MIWRGGRGREPNTAPAADAVPVDTSEVVAAEQHARIRHAARIAHRALQKESCKPEALRDTALVDLCLDIRSALQPSPPAVHREPPLPVPDRYRIPVIPGVLP